MRMEGVTLAMKCCKLIFSLFYLQKFQSSNPVCSFETHISNAKQDEIPEYKISAMCPTRSQFSILLHTSKSMLLRIKYKTFESLQMHTKNANNCCARTACSVQQRLFMCIIWLWLVKWILLFVFCQRVPFGLVVQSGEYKMRPASYLTFHVQFSINCIWIALKRYVCLLSEWMQAQTMRFKSHCFGMNEWAGWWTKSQFFFRAATKTGSKGMHTRWIFNIVYSLLLSHMLKMQTHAVWHTSNRRAHC